MKHICPKCGTITTGRQCKSCNPAAAAPDRTYADQKHLAEAYAICDSLRLTTTEQLRARVKELLAAERTPSKAWAHKLLDKHARGEHVALLSLQFARTALHQPESLPEPTMPEPAEPALEEYCSEF